MALLVLLATVAGGAQQLGYREVTDEVGRRVPVPATIRRLVSLAPSLTETVFALGADRLLVGVTDYCDYPPEAAAKPRVGGIVNPSIERIAALQPDLVLASLAANRRETVNAVERLGIPVYVTGARSVEGVLDSMRRLAELLGLAERGEALLGELRTTLDAVNQRLAGRAPRRVLFIVWEEPLISVGRDTFLADALRRAGAESVIETGQDWPRLNLEEVLKLQPEFLVFADAQPDAAARVLAGLRQRRGWRYLEAVQQQRVAVISDAVNRPSPRLVEAIEQLARQLHPEAFAPGAPTPRGLR